ncbi:MFS transporter [Streptomyces sp. NPDC004752]
MTGGTGHQLSPERERATLATISRRVMPLVVVGYVMAYLDRIDVGYAQLGMGTELGISAAAYGVAAGIFFIAYFICEVPSNLMLRRFGSRIWLGRIMITWGLISAAMIFVHSLNALLVLRFLLGVAEAGFFPGIILYLMSWFPEKRRSVALGWLILAQPVAYILGGSVGGLILEHVHWFGLSSWRWVFFLPGAATFVVGLITLFKLPESPDRVRWLDDDQKRWLTATLNAEQGPPPNHGIRAQLAALRERRVLHLAAIFFMVQTGDYGFSFFLPLIIKQINPEYSDTNIGLAAALPFVAAGVFTVVLARAGARAREQRMYILGPVLLTILGLVIVVLYKDQSVPAMVGICLTSVGVYAWGPAFFTMASMSISRTQAAVGIAVVNSIGNLGGFVGPYVVGLSADQGATQGMILSIIPLVVTVVLLLIWRTPRVQPGSEASVTELSRIPG